MIQYILQIHLSSFANKPSTLQTKVRVRRLPRFNRPAHPTQNAARYGPIALHSPVWPSSPSTAICHLNHTLHWCGRAAAALAQPGIPGDV